MATVQKILEAKRALDELLGPELTEIIEAMKEEPGPKNKYFVEIPSGEKVDYSIEEMMALVAVTSNRYQRAARAAGLARSLFKISEARYKLKFKTSLTGKNTAEREANAMEAATQEFLALAVVESCVELAESLESAAKMANESAKKILDKIQTMYVAQRREEKGAYRESDFGR